MHTHTHNYNTHKDPKSSNHPPPTPLGCNHSTDSVAVATEERGRSWRNEKNAIQIDTDVICIIFPFENNTTKWLSEHRWQADETQSSLNRNRIFLVSSAREMDADS